MTITRFLLSLLLLGYIPVFVSHADAQTDCNTIERIEGINEGNLEQTAHIKGNDAIVFIALDPSLSAPEFDYGDNYRDEHFIKAIKKLRKSLYRAGIDEVVVWKLPFPSMGVAIPFKQGCAINGYGEPDFHEKLMLMNEAFLVISMQGLETSSARDSIKKLIQGTNYAHMYKDEMVDIIINNLRPLIAKIPASDRNYNGSSDFRRK